MSQAAPAHIGCSVPGGSGGGGSAKPLGSHPPSQMTHCQDGLPDRNIS